MHCLYGRLRTNYVGSLRSSYLKFLGAQVTKLPISGLGRPDSLDSVYAVNWHTTMSYCGRRDRTMVFDGLIVVGSSYLARFVQRFLLFAVGIRREVFWE